MTEQTVNRRRFAQIAAAGLGMGVVALLQACAPRNPGVSAPTPAGSRTVQLPNHYPVQGIKPDLPPSPDGLIDAAFINYPADPPKTVPDTPGRGGDVTVTTWTTGAAPTPMESNALWQAVNKELGVQLKISIQAQADYA